MSHAICRKGTCAAAAAASLPAVDCSLVEYLLFCEAANEEQLLPVTLLRIHLRQRNLQDKVSPSDFACFEKSTLRQRRRRRKRNCFILGFSFFDYFLLTFFLSFFPLTVLCGHIFNSAETVDILYPVPQTFASPCSRRFAVSVTQLNSLETSRFECAGNFPCEEYKYMLCLPSLSLARVLGDGSAPLMTAQSLSCANSRKASCWTDVFVLDA